MILKNDPNSRNTGKAPLLQIRRRLVQSCFFMLGIVLLAFIATGSSSCSVYRFKDVSIPDSIKSVKVNFIENKARYVNPQLSPQLTDKLRQKIVNQTRLTQTNGDADWEITAFISDYSVSTAAISEQKMPQIV